MSPEAPFGRVLTAMVTPFTPDGAAVDLDAARRRWLTHPHRLVTEVVTGPTCALVGVRR